MIVIKADYDTYQECGKNKADKKILRPVFRMIQQINLRKRAFHGKFYSHNKTHKPQKTNSIKYKISMNGSTQI